METRIDNITGGIYRIATMTEPYGITFNQFLIDDEEPPSPKHRDIDWRKMLLAAAVQGAIFRAAREASDHYSRRAFARTTGTWPGKESPEDE